MRNFFGNLPFPAAFCAVCFGDGKSKIAGAIWPGVYLLLGLVAFVLAAVAYLGWTWIRRESRGQSI